METPYNYNTPNWEPLERAVRQAGLPLEVCGEFMWMAEFVPGQHSYKHCNTRKYAVLNVNPTPIDDFQVREARR